MYPLTWEGSSSSVALKQMVCLFVFVEFVYIVVCFCRWWQCVSRRHWQSGFYYKLNYSEIKHCRAVCCYIARSAINRGQMLCLGGRGVTDVTKCYVGCNMFIYRYFWSYPWASSAGIYKKLFIQILNHLYAKRTLASASPLESGPEDTSLLSEVEDT